MQDCVTHLSDMCEQFYNCDRWKWHKAQESLVVQQNAGLLVSYRMKSRKEGFMTCQRMLTFNWVGLLFGNCCKRRRVSSPRVSRWLIENSMFTRWTKIEVARYTYIKKMPVPCNFQTVIIKVNANNLHVTNQTRVITHFR